jgi:hypothetical protein
MIVVARIRKVVVKEKKSIRKVVIGIRKVVVKKNKSLCVVSQMRDSAD